MAGERGRIFDKIESTAHMAVIQRVQTLPGSRTGTVDPGTGRVYVIASKPDTAASVHPSWSASRLLFLPTLGFSGWGLKVIRG